MQNKVPLEQRRYLKKDSERSGFTYFKRELIRDNGRWVHPDEFDEPPPHPRFIGGEGDSNTGDMRSNRKTYPTAKTEIWTP